jgi:hypothetical protein
MRKIKPPFANPLSRRDDRRMMLPLGGVTFFANEEKQNVTGSFLEQITQ